MLGHPEAPPEGPLSPEDDSFGCSTLKLSGNRENSGFGALFRGLPGGKFSETLFKAHEYRFGLEIKGLMGSGRSGDVHPISRNIEESSGGGVRFITVRTKGSRRFA